MLHVGGDFRNARDLGYGAGRPEPVGRGHLFPKIAFQRHLLLGVCAGFCPRTSKSDFSMSLLPDNDQERSLALQERSLKVTNRANWLLLKIVLINLALYFAIAELVGFNALPGDPIYPTFVLFLSFAFSIGNLLIVGLREQIDLGAVNNKWVKKIGVTPVMVIVAVLISILAGFTPLANLILPAKALNFMMANVRLTCNEADKSFAPQANALLVMINSDKEWYIKEVTNHLSGISSSYTEMVQGFFARLFGSEYPQKFEVDFVKKNNQDPRYKLLKSFADQGQFGSEGLQDAMSTEEKWTAYTVRIRAPREDTPIPVPTVYEEHHSTRIFLIVRNPQVGKDPAVAAVNDAAGQTTARDQLSPRC
jgi:hypothetical protein